MTEPKKPGAYTRAEAGARRAVLVVSSGVVSFVVGGFLMSGVSVRLSERFGPIDDPLAALAWSWVLQRLWLWLVLPAAGYAAGRFLESRPLTFALVAGLAGETFSVLLSAARDGFEFVFQDTTDVTLRAITLAAGIAVVAFAVKLGASDAEAGQASADAEAAKKKAEYEAYLQKMEAQPPKPGDGPPA